MRPDRSTFDRPAHGPPGRRAVPRPCARRLTAACGDMQREGTASSFLIVNALEAARGSDPTKFGGTLASDVLTVVKRRADGLQRRRPRSLSLGMKDPGSASSPTAPTSANFITLTRYHVQVQALGRPEQAEGVDVPYAFDGALTPTVTDRRCHGRVHAGAQHRQGGSAAARRSRSNGRHPLDDRGESRSTATIRRAGGQRHRDHLGRLRQFRGQDERGP